MVIIKDDQLPPFKRLLERIDQTIPGKDDLLRILWKRNLSDSPVTYRLKTVTYGTKSAPFLAIKCIKQVAYDEMHKYPEAAKAVLSDCYVDDVISGSSNLDSARELKNQLIQLFHSCGMTLHKWNSNSPELLDSPSTSSELSFSSKSDNVVKALGITWNSQKDEFSFKVSIKEKSSYTKRDILSTIARLYDPLGLIGPVITKAKIFLQKLWVQKLSWDEPFFATISHEWQQIVSNLKAVENIKVNRCILSNHPSKISLIGYADASEAAYGAVVYLICVDEDHGSSSHLLASKSRVAPLKTLSIPRLELCACLLLAHLISKVSNSLKMHLDDIILCTDSTIALSWLKTSPHLLKTFVANRVSKIQRLVEPRHWKHVSSANNPADLISRGAYPHELVTSSLWWNGPEQNELSDASLFELDKTLIDSPAYQDELKKPLDVNLNCNLNLFLSNLKGPVKKTGPISSTEYQDAEMHLIKMVQVIEFAEEIKSLQDQRVIKSQ
ncbi:uncharacterized protein LOC118204289, partial [Stegodyphus dumicola]|uniref:uncharacterized protein LOC118204289 n=1 Tax=Stegodyphus dumicola TaxID=202533 RepID=UPI0015B154C3